MQEPKNVNNYEHLKDFSFITQYFIQTETLEDLDKVASILLQTQEQHHHTISSRHDDILQISVVTKGKFSKSDMEQLLAGIKCVVVHDRDGMLLGNPLLSRYSRKRNTHDRAEDYERKVMSDVLDEWIRQRNLGFDLEHDLSHSDGELSFAAVAYAIHQVPHPTPALLERPSPTWHELWPWEHSYYNPRTRRENLLRAIALLLSEVTRLDAKSSPLENKESS